MKINAILNRALPIIGPAVGLILCGCLAKPYRVRVQPIQPQTRMQIESVVADMAAAQSGVVFTFPKQ